LNVFLGSPHRFCSGLSVSQPLPFLASPFPPIIPSASLGLSSHPSIRPVAGFLFSFLNPRHQISARVSPRPFVPFSCFSDLRSILFVDSVFPPFLIGKLAITMSSYSLLVVFSSSLQFFRRVRTWMLFRFFLPCVIYKRSSSNSRSHPSRILTSFALLVFSTFLPFSCVPIFSMSLFSVVSSGLNLNLRLRL